MNNRTFDVLEDELDTIIEVSVHMSGDLAHSTQRLRNWKEIFTVKSRAYI